MSAITEQTFKLLTFAMLKGVGPAALKKIAFVEGFLERDPSELAQSVPAIAKVFSDDPVGAWMVASDAAKRQLDAAQKHAAFIISPLDDIYPSLLAETRDDPFILYVKGVLSSRPAQSIAIIGTREPTGSGEIIAQRFSETFARKGWSVVSGLAIGCDSIAHRTALDAGAHTVAVLAHGLQMISPAQNRGLAEEILAAGGALVSEYPFGLVPQGPQFVKRDRTQAGMAQGVIMIQSDTRGGSLHASRAALDYGRWLGVPFPTPKDMQRHEPKIQGNLVILEGSQEERTQLLRCSPEALGRVLKLRTKEDVLRLASDDIANTRVRQIPGQVAEPREDSATAPLFDTNEPVEKASPQSAASHEGVSAIAHDLHALRDSVRELLDPSSDLTQAGESDVRERELQALPNSSADANAKPLFIAAPQKPNASRSSRVHLVWCLRSMNDKDIARILRAVDSLRVSGRFDESFADGRRGVDLKARLGRITQKLQELMEWQSTHRIAPSHSALVGYSLVLEEVLLHMHNVVKSIKALGENSSKPILIKVPLRQPSGQLSMIKMNDSDDDHFLDFSQVLNQVVRAMPRALKVESETNSNLKNRADRRKEIDMINFLDAFISYVTCDPEGIWAIQA